MALIWLNLTCLDAPLVAVAWQWIFARSLHVAVPGASRLALFFTAWLIYLGDRFVSSVSLSGESPKSARERFCQKHRHVWFGLTLIVAVFDGIVVFGRVDRAIFRRGILLALIALAYLVINLRFGRLWRILPVKEMCVGFLFAGGTLLVLVPQLRMARSTIDFAAFLFASVCALNCISIAAWERDLDIEQHKFSIATGWQSVEAFAEALLVLLFSCSSALAFLDPTVRVLALCLGLSSALLFVLHFISINRDVRTALADLVLLTPVVFLAAEKLT